MHKSNKKKKATKLNYPKRFLIELSNRNLDAYQVNYSSFFSSTTECEQVKCPSDAKKMSFKKKNLSYSHCRNLTLPLGVIPYLKLIWIKI